ncbi:MAG: DUF4747 family protein [Burkholderiaceae bacterium]|nr:DUF4747 family protein [Burkholderiaceae bacterium]
MKLRIYNIQLLPLDHEKTPDAGETRYLKLFDSLNKEVTKTIKNRRLVTDAKALVNDSFFAALNCEQHSNKLIGTKNKYDFVVGRFIKFHQAGEVEDLYTKATLFKAQDGQSAIANRKEFIYVFDPETHWLAIEEQNGRLPNQKAVEKALSHYLQPVAEFLFPDYILTVNLVSRTDELNAVLERAVGFTKIDVDITFKNGPTQNEVLQDMARNSLHRLRVTATSERGSHMPKMPETIDGIVRNAAQYGSASITYLEQNDKGGVNVSRYESDSNPETITTRTKGNEDPLGFYGRICLKLKSMAKSLGHIPALEDAK